MTKPRELPRTLKHGSHDPGDDMCVMEAAAWMAGEPWTDHPECVSPVIAAFLRNWNDSITSDEAILTFSIAASCRATRSPRREE